MSDLKLAGVDLEDKLSRTQQDTVALVCCADNNYAMPLAVMVRSACENLSHQYKLLVFVIDGGIQAANKKRIWASVDPTRCDIRFIAKPDDLIKDFEGFKLSDKTGLAQLASHITGPALFKLLIPEILPSDLDRAIFLDCDLVVRGDLGKLWDTNLDDKYILAVQEFWIPYISAKGGIVNYQELGLPGDAKYFNSGVMVFNLKKWREDKISAKAIEYFKQNKEFLLWWDQDVLNAILVNQWGELDPKWNVTPGVHKVISGQHPLFPQTICDSLIQDPYVVHYATASKPWSTPKTSFLDTFVHREVFFQYVDLTDWSGWRLNFWRLTWVRVKRKWRSLKSSFLTKS